MKIQNGFIFMYRYNFHKALFRIRIDSEKQDTDRPRN